MITTKEKKKGIRKNIDNIISIYDSGKSPYEKEKNIREKMDSDIKRLRERLLPEKERLINIFNCKYICLFSITNFEKLSIVLEHMKTELINVMILLLYISKRTKNIDNECMPSKRTKKNGHY